MFIIEDGFHEIQIINYLQQILHLPIVHFIPMMPDSYVSEDKDEVFNIDLWSSSIDPFQQLHQLSIIQDYLIKEMNVMNRKESILVF